MKEVKQLLAVIEEEIKEVLRESDKDRAFSLFRMPSKHFPLEDNLLHCEAFYLFQSSEFPKVADQPAPQSTEPSFASFQNPSKQAMI